MILIYISQILAFAVAITVHEASHGWIADKLGDRTARSMGRITLNPIAHIDPLGTVILPLFLVIFRSPFVFGWAKPVPVNANNLRNPRKDMLWIGLGGPLANIITAVIFSVISRGSFILPNTLAPIFINNVILINLVLAFFNLIPVPPLDGYKILSGLLPREAAVSYSRIEPYGMWIIIGLLFLRVIDVMFALMVWPIYRVLAG